MSDIQDIVMADAEQEQTRALGSRDMDVLLESFHYFIKCADEDMTAFETDPEANKYACISSAKRQLKLANARLEQI